MAKTRGARPAAAAWRCTSMPCQVSWSPGADRILSRPVSLFFESECDDDLIIIEEDNIEALSRGTGMTPNEAWADAVAAMGPDRARMFSSDADVEPVPGLGFGLGVD